MDAVLSHRWTSAWLAPAVVVGTPAIGIVVSLATEPPTETHRALRAGALAAWAFWVSLPFLVLGTAASRLPEPAFRAAALWAWIVTLITSLPFGAYILLTIAPLDTYDVFGWATDPIERPSFLLPLLLAALSPIAAGAAAGASLLSDRRPSRRRHG